MKPLPKSFIGLRDSDSRRSKSKEYRVHPVGVVEDMYSKEHPTYKVAVFLNEALCAIDQERKFQDPYHIDLTPEEFVDTDWALIEVALFAMLNLYTQANMQVPEYDPNILLDKDLNASKADLVLRELNRHNVTIGGNPEEVD